MLRFFTANRRQAALHELQRMEVEDSLRPIGGATDGVPLQKGTLTISKIVLPLKEKYVKALAAGNCFYYVLISNV